MTESNSTTANTHAAWLPRTCKRCGTIISRPESADHFFCDEACKLLHMGWLNSVAPKPKKAVRLSPAPSRRLSPVPGVGHPWKWLADPRTMFKDEDQFTAWFLFNSFWFGVYEVTSFNPLFPDVIGLDKDGQLIRVELEYNAASFSRHGHDPSGCDLICSFVKPRKMTAIGGLEVRSVFTASCVQNNINPSTIKLSSYMQRRYAKMKSAMD